MCNPFVSLRSNRSGKWLQRTLLARQGLLVSLLELHLLSDLVRFLRSQSEGQVAGSGSATEYLVDGRSGVRRSGNAQISEGDARTSPRRTSTGTPINRTLRPPASQRVLRKGTSKMHLSALSPESLVGLVLLGLLLLLDRPLGRHVGPQLVELLPLLLLRQRLDLRAGREPVREESQLSLRTGRGRERGEDGPRRCSRRSSGGRSSRRGSWPVPCS